jgi:signal peptidase I
MGKSRRKREARVLTRSRSIPHPSRVIRTRALLMSVLPAFAIFVGTRQLLAEAYRIPSGSMEPTLLVGDWLFVNKLRFGG